MKRRATDVPMHPLRCAAQKSRFSTIPWLPARIVRSKNRLLPVRPHATMQIHGGFHLTPTPLPKVKVPC